MLVNLSPWTSTSTSIQNDSNSSKKKRKNSILVSSFTSILTLKQSRKNKRSSSEIYSGGIVLTHPHSISILNEKTKIDPKSNEIDQEIETEWTISSRPGKSHAFIPSVSSKVTPQKYESIPSVYDPHNRQLYALVKKNTCIEIHNIPHTHLSASSRKTKTNGKKSMTGKIQNDDNENNKGVDNGAETFSHIIDIKSTIQALFLHDPHGNHKENETNPIVIGCTQDSKIILIPNGSPSYQTIDAFNLKTLLLNGSVNTDSKDNNAMTVNHLWTDIQEFKENNSQFELFSLWLHESSGTVILRRVLFSLAPMNYDDDEQSQKLNILRDDKKVMMFSDIVGPITSTTQCIKEQNAIDFGSIQVCPFQSTQFAFLFKQSNPNDMASISSEEQDQWYNSCCYCSIQWNEKISEIQLLSNRTFSLDPFFVREGIDQNKDNASLFDLYPKYTCALNSRIMAIYLQSRDDPSFSKILLCDASREGVLLKSISCHEYLPFLTSSSSSILGMISNPSLNQLILFDDQHITMTSLQLSSSMTLLQNEDEEMNSQLRKKRKVIKGLKQPVFNLANLLASSIAMIPETNNQINDDVVNTSISMVSTAKVTKAANMKEYDMISLVHNYKTVPYEKHEDKDWNEVLKQMHESMSPETFQTIFNESIPLDEQHSSSSDCINNSEISNSNKIQKKTSAKNPSVPVYFIKGVCSLSLQIIQHDKSSSGVTDSKWDPILQVVLRVFSMYPQLVSRCLLDGGVTNIVKLPLVLIYRLLQLSTNNNGGGVVTEYMKVNVWNYILFHVPLEEVVHFYSFHLKYFHSLSDDLKTNINPLLKMQVSTYMKWKKKHQNNDSIESYDQFSNITQTLLSQVAHDISSALILNDESNDALLRTALYHQDIMKGDEVAMEILVLASIFKVNGSQKRLVQWMNAVLDVHGGIIAQCDQASNCHVALKQLHKIVNYESNLSEDIINLQTCLHLVSPTLNKENTCDGNDLSGVKVIDTNMRSNGSTIIPGYGVERLCL